MRDAAGQLADGLQLLRFPKLGFCRQPPAHIHHASQHAQGDAGGITDDQTSVDYMCLGRVSLQEPVLVRPFGRRARDRRAYAGQDPLAIIGMDVPSPEVGVATDLAAMPELGFHMLVPPDFVGREIPVPDHVVGDRGHQTETLLAGAQRLDRATTLGDVLEMNRQTVRRRISPHLEPAVQRLEELLEAYRLARPHGVGIAGLEAAPDRLGKFLPQGLAHQVVPRTTQQVGGRIVQEGETPAVVQHHEGFGAGVQGVRQTFLRGLRIGPRADQFIDVLEGAPDGYDPALGVPLGLADGAHPEAPPASGDDLQDQIERNPVVDAGAKGGVYDRPMLGNVEHQARFGRFRSLGHLMDRGRFVAPNDRGLEQIDAPAAEARHAPGHGQEGRRLALSLKAPRFRLL
ncbi:hypothetical protein D3C80_895320 [compost metagenome]